MKLGIAINWVAPRIEIPLECIRLAETPGFDSVWSAEAYGSDALTPLAFITGQARRICLGTVVAQAAARAMATLDQLAGKGRVICGLGLSCPQVVEGWYGRPWERPYYVMKDYVATLKKIWAREVPVTHEGKAISLPAQDAAALDYGKPLKSILHCNRNIPVWLGTGSQSMVTLTAEAADGWLPFGFSPGAMAIYGPWLEEGFRHAGNRASMTSKPSRLLIFPPRITGLDTIQKTINHKGFQLSARQRYFSGIPVLNSTFRYVCTPGPPAALDQRVA